MIDAKPIPGTREVLANFSPGHGVNEHAGAPPSCPPASALMTRPRRKRCIKAR
ncbi:MAG: hypothetical protein H7A45_15635 [Verrucomicrobiales bacterium]|nr:hypothetical protein [Verrucomicrobiales bacterium]